MTEPLQIEEQPVAKMDSNYATAILMLLLEDDDAANLIRSFDPKNVQQLGRSMFDAAQATEIQIESAIERFILAARNLPSLAQKANPHIRSVFTNALGSEKAQDILQSIGPSVTNTSFEKLKWLDHQTVGSILAQEHPQVGAAILSALEPQVAAAALAGLPEDIQSDLVFRAARLGSITTDAAATVEAILDHYTVKTSSSGKVTMGGKSETARIVNKLKKEDGTRILKSVKRKDKVIGQQIEDEMFIFDNLMDLDDKSLGAVTRAVESDILSMALKGANDALTQRILSCMSVRAAQTIQDEMEERGMAKRADVEEAQKAIITLVRRMEEDGSIMIGGDGDDYV